MNEVMKTKVAEYNAEELLTKARLAPLEAPPGRPEPAAREQRRRQHDGQREAGDAPAAHASSATGPVKR